MSTSEKRIDIQILRGVAVLAVAIFHFWPAVLPGGFAGVDVFFAVSGFLITQLLEREIARTGRIHLIDFWIRRIRRIFPAAITVIFATVGVFSVFASPRQIFIIAKHAIASTFSLENALLWWQSTDYNAGQLTASPFQHYWSLAVEEQFYLVWPVVLTVVIAIAIRSRRTFVTTARYAIIGIGLASLIYALWISESGDGSYFDPFARAWELAVGALLALSPGLFSTMSSRVAAILRTVSWIGLVIVFIPAGLEKYVPGLGVLPSAIFAALLLALPRNEFPRPTVVARVVRNALVWVGDRSFSMYLWHWPALLIAPFLFDRELTGRELLGLFAVVLVLSDLSYRFVENPVRRSRSPWLVRPRLILPLSMSICLALVAAVMLIPTGKGEALPTTFATSMLSAPLPSATDGTPPPSARYPFVKPNCVGAAAAVFDCPTVNGVKYNPYPTGSTGRELSLLEPCANTDSNIGDECLFGDASSNRRIALIGDSKAGTWVGAIDQLGKRAGVAVVFLNRLGCGYRTDALNACKRHNRIVRETLVGGGFELVVLAQHARPESPSRYTAALQDLDDNGVPLVVIRDTSLLAKSTMNCVSYRFPEIDSCDQPRSESFPPDATASAAAELGIPVFDFSDILCGPETCSDVIGGVQIHEDGNHMFRTFVLTLTPFLWSDLRQLGYFAD
jgi:peptidoglycan/LPS O-acetylase OafA/YrhL